MSQISSDQHPDDPSSDSSRERIYSASLMGRALLLAGLAPDQAYHHAATIGIELDKTAAAGTAKYDLFATARAVVGARAAQLAISQLERLEALQAIDLPIILLIGGTTGTGKSTIATEVAHRLAITRLSSTDFIRQTLRAVFAKGFMSAIHYSSFDAGEAVGDEVGFDPLLTGFVEQSRHVCVGVEAAVSRAVTERWSMVLEGVHLIPGLYPAKLDGAIVVPVVIHVPDPDLHRQYFHVRSIATGGLRPKQRYLDRFDEIRRIQSHIVARANRDDVTVVENTDLDNAVEEVIGLVLNKANALEPGTERRDAQRSQIQP
jgi:2-phosphoglycerate kinase